MAVQGLPILYWYQTQGLFVLSKHSALELYPVPSVAFKNLSNPLQLFQVHTGVPCEMGVVCWQGTEGRLCELCGEGTKMDKDCF